MMFNILELWIIVFVFVIYSDCQCRFPSSIHGTWVRASDSHEFTVTAGRFAGFNYRSGGQHYDFFQCDAVSGNTYRLMYSQTDLYSNTISFVYLCFDLRGLGPQSFIMTDLGGVTALIAGNNGTSPIVNVPGFVTDTPITSFMDVCIYDVTQIQSNIVIRKNPGSVKTLCPENIFGNYNYTLDGTKCTGNSSLAVCTDRMSVTIDLVQCSDIVAYSNGGVMDCIGHTTMGGTVYFWTYNRDATVDSSNTHRIVCYALSGSGQLVSMSFHPVDCPVAQTPTSVASPGGTLDMVALELCPLTGSSGEGVPIAAVAGGAVVGILIIGGIILAVLLIMRKRKKKRRIVSAQPSKSPQRKGSQVNGVASHPKPQPTVAPVTLTAVNEVRNGNVTKAKEDNPKVNQEQKPKENPKAKEDSQPKEDPKPKEDQKTKEDLKPKEDQKVKEDTKPKTDQKVKENPKPKDAQNTQEKTNSKSDNGGVVSATTSGQAPTDTPTAVATSNPVPIAASTATSTAAVVTAATVGSSSLASTNATASQTSPRPEKTKSEGDEKKKKKKKKKKKEKD